MKLCWISCVFVAIQILQVNTARKKTRPRDGVSLTSALWPGYDRIFRPGELDGGGTTAVNFTMAIEDIIRVHEGTMGASVSFLATISLAWYDLRLTWSPEALPRHKLHIPAVSLWTPDIRLINNLEPRAELDFKIRSTIYSNGRVSIQVPAQLLVHCGRPRDSRANWECILPFSSWTYDPRELELNLVGEPYAQLSNYDDRVWLITGNSATRGVRRAQGIDHTELIYTIKILRR